MSPLLRRILTALGLFGLLLAAWAPLLDAGFLAEDYRVALAAGRPGADEVELWEQGLESKAPSELSLRSAMQVDPAVDGGPGWSLEGLSLYVSRQLWGTAPGGAGAAPAARWWRAENLFLLALGALGLSRFLRRLLWPWTGSDQAAAASMAAAVLFALHPLTGAKVVTLSGRGQLLALVLAAWAAAAFLRGRQDRNYFFTAGAWILCSASALAGEFALSLPLTLAVAEYLSSHRYRKRRDRLRTSTTTLLTFGAGFALAYSLRGLGTTGIPQPSILAGLVSMGSPSGILDFVGLGVEKLGVLVLPSNVHSTGIFGTALAGLLFLLAIQPALVAARSAPRLWGWLLCAWFAALFVAVLPGAEMRVRASQLGDASALFGAAAVMSVGLGVASTAVSGLSRSVVPWVLAIGFATLNYGNARPFALAADFSSRLREDLIAARASFGADSQILVIDPLAPIRGVEPLSDSLEWMLHPAFDAEGSDASKAGSLANSERESSGEPLPGPKRSRVSALTARAFLAFAREEEFDAMRSSGLGVLLPLQAGEENGSEPERMALPLPPSEPSTGTRTWRGDARSPDLDLEALEVSFLRITPAEGVDTQSPQTVSWRARVDLPLTAELSGAWIVDGGVSHAVFDLGSSLAWRLGGRVRRMWFETGLLTLSSAEVLDELPELGREWQPESQGDDWLFGIEGAPAAEELPDGARFGLGLLDLDRYEYVELPGVLEGRKLRVPRAAEEVARIVGSGHGPVAWHLDLVHNSVSIARTGGRRSGRLGSREETR